MPRRTFKPCTCSQAADGWDPPDYWGTAAFCADLQDARTAGHHHLCSTSFLQVIGAERYPGRRRDARSPLELWVGSLFYTTLEELVPRIRLKHPAYRMGTRLDDADGAPAARGELQTPATAAAPERESGSSDLRNGSGVTDAPPFWSTNRHRRTASSASILTIDQARPAAITLEDHSKDDDEQALSCWAQSVTIDDYSVVSGNGSIGAYVVWHLTVSTLYGGDMPLNKRLSIAPRPHGQCEVADCCIHRYSEFDRLRTDLIRAFPHAEAQIPELPRKSVVSRFRPRFLEHRKNGLAHFMKYVASSLWTAVHGMLILRAVASC